MSKNGTEVESATRKAGAAAIVDEPVDNRRSQRLREGQKGWHGHLERQTAGCRVRWRCLTGRAGGTLRVPFKEVLPRDNESLIRAGLGDGFCARCSDLPCPRWIVDNIAKAFRELIGVARIGDEKMDSISQLVTVPLLVGDFSLRRSDKNRTPTSRATIGPWIASRKPRSKKHTAVQARMNSGTRQFGRNGRISVRSAMPASTRALRIVGPES